MNSYLHFLPVFQERSPLLTLKPPPSSSRPHIMNPYLAAAQFPFPIDIRMVHPSGRHGRCSASGTYCGNRPISDVIRGERVKSLYCEYHHCHMVENGQMCRVAKPPKNERYCNERERKKQLRVMLLEELRLTRRGGRFAMYCRGKRREVRPARQGREPESLHSLCRVPWVNHTSFSKD